MAAGFISGDESLVGGEGGEWRRVISSSPLFSLSFLWHQQSVLIGLTVTEWVNFSSFVYLRLSGVTQTHLNRHINLWF